MAPLGTTDILLFALAGLGCAVTGIAIVRDALREAAQPPRGVAAPMEAEVQTPTLERAA